VARPDTGPNGFPAMLRLALAAVAVAALAASASAQVIYTSPRVIYSQPVVQSPRPQPAVGLGAVNSPFWFGPDFSVGGPGYLYRAYPPHNGWSSGYRGAHYGEPVPGAAARRGRWSR
jgi:hypothetical protein